MQRQSGKAGGSRGADAVLGSGPLAGPQLQCGDRGVLGVGGEAGQAHHFGIGEVWASLADDHPYAGGQLLRQSPSISAPQVLSRVSPSGQTAGVHAPAGTFRPAACIGSVMAMPTEYDSHCARLASQATNSWVPPPESQR